MLKCKIFEGSFNVTTNGKTNNADEQFNDWIKDHQNVTIKEFKYNHTYHGYHSICLLYEEKE